ncbi:hypothetical protein BD770DRAFT_471941 [Pilaira anomala]|nr:hypothetical protein BD770DRAFT_471941 [Pilaira anomala]
MVFIPSFNDTKSSLDSTGTDVERVNIDVNNYNNHNSNNSGSNGFLVAIEVIFSLLVVFILIFCLYFGFKKKRLLRKRREEIIQTAIERQERRIQQMQCQSSTTVTTLMSCPLPAYSPPDPANRLTSSTVSRLNQLLLESQMTINRGLPKYSEQ